MPERRQPIAKAVRARQQSRSCRCGWPLRGIGGWRPRRAKLYRAAIRSVGNSRWHDCTHDASTSSSQYASKAPGAIPISPDVSAGHEWGSGARPASCGEALCRERMFDLIALGDNLAGARFALDGARDRFLHSLVVVLLNLLVVGRVPMDENTHTDEQIVGFIGRNGSVGHAVGDRFRDRVLCRAEHLNGLL